MKVRVILVCTLLLLVALPSFALPQCRECNVNLRCEVVPGAFERCYDGPGFCYTDPIGNCTHFTQSTVSTDWKVVSIEITRPALDSLTITAPAPSDEVPAPAPQATESK